jgi:hypothetical protein
MAALGSLVLCEHFPPGLKPVEICAAYVRSEARTLQSDVFSGLWEALKRKGIEEAAIFFRGGCNVTRLLRTIQMTGILS